MSPFKLNSQACLQHTALRNIGGVMTVKLSKGSLGVTEYGRFKDFIQQRGDFRASDIMEMTISDNTDISDDEMVVIRGKQVLLVKLNNISYENYVRIAQKVFTPRVFEMKRVFIFSEHMDEFIPIEKVKNLLAQDIWTPAIEAIKNFENVCFLDIDGVFCNKRTSVLSRWECTNDDEFINDPITAIKAMDQVGIKFLSRLAPLARLKFILSSQWRIGMTDEEVIAFGRYMNIPIVGKVVHGGNRTAEISKWIRDNKPRGQLCYLDDERNTIPGVVPFIVKSGDGITWETMTDMSNFFNLNVHTFCDSKFSYVG